MTLKNIYFFKQAFYNIDHQIKVFQMLMWTIVHVEIDWTKKIAYLDLLFLGYSCLNTIKFTHTSCIWHHYDISWCNKNKQKTCL